MTNAAHPSRTRDLGFWMPCLGIAAVALAIDQWTKLHAESDHLLSPPWPTMAQHRASTAMLLDLQVIQLKITHVANAGVVLGLLEETLWPLPVVAFYGASLLTLAAAAALLRHASPPHRVAQAAAIALIVGVVGNMVDRLRLGYVIDWFYAEAHWAGRSFDIPAFNVADLALAAGASLATLYFGQRLAARRATRSVTSRRTEPSTTA